MEDYLQPVSEHHPLNNEVQVPSEYFHIITALLDIELNVYFTKTAIKLSLSKSAFEAMIFELRGLSLEQTCHQHHMLLPTLSSSDALI